MRRRLSFLKILIITLCVITLISFSIPFIIYIKNKIKNKKTTKNTYKNTATFADEEIPIFITRNKNDYNLRCDNTIAEFVSKHHGEFLINNIPGKYCIMRDTDHMYIPQGNYYKKLNNNIFTEAENCSNVVGLYSLKDDYAFTQKLSFTLYFAEIFLFHGQKYNVNLKEKILRNRSDKFINNYNSFSYFYLYHTLLFLCSNTYIQYDMIMTSSKYGTRVIKKKTNEHEKVYNKIRKILNYLDQVNTLISSTDQNKKIFNHDLNSILEETGIDFIKIINVLISQLSNGAKTNLDDILQKIDKSDNVYINDYITYETCTRERIINLQKMALNYLNPLDCFTKIYQLFRIDLTNGEGLTMKDKVFLYKDNKNDQLFRKI
ncbi:hypothetical protein SLOPH_1057 [Spraguea lophii 42_110]|uniref:Uncharacterized protein n=1 Tax=Spraguea lophii (strain 42_110) TaxID=1358809 RepID=S7XI04_SPRLO|nr:hypothetical protein SLOPH_1057 [Spraguea lophii 42_110]